MINIIKESYIYKFFYNLMILPFENSFLKRAISIINRVIKDSKTNSILFNYINKKPYFINSYSQKIFRKVVNYIDKIANFLNKVSNRIISSSKIFINIKNIHKKSVYKNLNVLSLCIICLIFGYSLGLIIVIENIAIKICLILLDITIIYTLFNINYLKNSLLFRLYKYLYKLVKM